MEKKYSTSRNIICAFTFLVSLIAFRNEDISVTIPASIIFTCISLIAGLIATPISKKIISHGNTLTAKSKRILYYFFLFLITIGFIGVFWVLIYFTMVNNTPSFQTFSETLGYAILVVFVLIASAICILVPYMQILIILLLNKITQNEKCKNEKS